MTFTKLRCAAILAMACIATANVDIPNDLKVGRMKQYAACRKLFAQDIENSAVVQEDAGQFKKVCNCSFHEAQTRLKIKCHYAREVVIPITIDMYQLLGHVTYFIVRYRIMDSGAEWQEQRVNVGGNQQATLILDLGFDGTDNVYEVEIYATLNDDSQRLIMSDQLSSTSGQSVLLPGGHSQPNVIEREYGQATQSFRMNFDRITDTSMEITFQTESSLAFKLEYINDGRRLNVTLDRLGKATLTELQPDTEYIFIISYNSGGEWVEMRRKPVRTMAARTFEPSVYEPTFNYGSRDITLKCPVTVDDNLQTVSWYKVPSGGSPQLVAIYDAQSGTTTYARNRDPKIEIIDGVVLRINDAGQEHAGHYKCRYAVTGLDDTWQSAVESELVTLYITWETQPGIVAYYIQYRPYLTTQRWQYVTLRDADRPSTIVRGLQPVTQYEFQVYDYSGGVRGDLLDTLVKATALTSDEGPIEHPCAQFHCGRGICEPSPRPHCVCDYGYTGAACDTVLNYCDPNPCSNGGICNPLSDGYTCQCRRGYSGDNCERERTACNPNPCRNLGVCVTVDNGYICRCRRGYEGLQCQLKDRSSPCDSGPCVHGTCSVLGRNYRCECERGYLGRNCDSVNNAPSILLQCPIQEDVYGIPELIQWIRVSPSGRLQLIYRYDVANENRAEGPVPQYRGRLYSPNMRDLIIRDSRPSDAGTYQCIVSYESAKKTPTMQLFRVPIDDSRITVEWRPSRLAIDRYDVRYRDVESDVDWAKVQIPSTSHRYTLRDLKPAGVYEISVLPHTRPNEVNEPVYLTEKPSDSLTTATTAVSTVISEEEIVVSVRGPASPVTVGTTAYLTCYYPTFGSYKPSIKWKKTVGQQEIFVYNEKMPPPPSRSRITMPNERRLRISNFQPSDAGTYECTVEFETARSVKVGKGSDDVEAAEIVQVPPPTNLIIDVTGLNTAILTWQPPRFRGVVNSYVVQYYPTTRRFGEYERRETTSPSIVLQDLVENSEYNVEIRATDGNSVSEPLLADFLQVIEKVSSPTSFRAQMLSPTTARIMWQQPDSGGLTGYKVKYWDINRPAAGNLVERRAGPRTTDMVLSNLLDGTVYQVWIHAVKGDSLSPQLTGQFRKTSPAMPNAPAQIQFKNIENDRVTAFWRAPVGWTRADKYRVNVKSLDNNFPFIKQYPDSAPAMITVTSLHPGVLYLFTLNTVRDGVLSSPVHGTVKTIELMTLVAPYPERLVLECKTTIANRIYQVKWYKIDHSGRGQLIFTRFSTPTRNESIPNRRVRQFADRLSAPSVTSLAISNVQYPIDFGKYKCAALAVDGNGRSTIELVAKYPTSIAPPEDIQFGVIDDTTAKITWQHPYAEDITSYVVKYRPNSDGNASEKIFETRKTEASLSDLTPGNDYQIDIKAKINNKESDDSLSGVMPFGQVEKILEGVLPGSLERTPGIAFPSPVSNLQVEALGRDSLSATWNSTPDVHFDFYRVLVTNTRTNQEEPFNATNPRITITQLQPYGSFDVAVSTVRNGAFSIPVVATVTLRDAIEESPPRVLEPGEEVAEFEPVKLAPAPTNLQFSNIMRTRFTVSWVSSDENTRDYEVKYRPTAARSQWMTVRTRGYSTYTLRNLRSGTEYEVQIYSILVTGQKSSPLTGRQSTQRELTTRVILRKPAVTVFDKTNDSFTLGWGQLDAAHRVYVTPIGGAGQRQNLNVGRGESSVVVTGLEAGTKHRAAVISMSGGRRSKPSYVYPTTNPNQPTDLQVLTLGSDSMVISWTEPASTLITGYRVIHYPTTTNAMEVLQATANRAEITGLTPETEYTIEVQTKQGGELSAKTTTTVTTKPETIAAPHNGEVSISGNDVIARWSPVLGAQSYKVVFYPEDDASAAETFTVEAPTSSKRIQDVRPGRYVLKITAVRDDQLSPTLDMSVTMGVKPPRNLVISDVRRNGLTATWVAPQNANFDPTYDVIALPTSIYSPLEVPSEKRTRETNFVFERLNSNTEYKVEVIARYGNLKSVPVEAIATTASLSPPDRVTSDILDGDVTIRWAPVDDVDNYEVTYYPVDDQSNQVTVSVPSGTTYYTFSSPGPGQYEIRIVAVKNGERSQPTRTRQTTSVESPSRVRFSDVTEEAIIVEWTPPRTRARYDYEVTLISADDVTRPSVSRRTQHSWQHFSGLEPATRYVAQVKTLFGDLSSEPVNASITTGVPIVRRVEVPYITDGNLPVDVVWQEVPDADNYYITYYPVGGVPREITVGGERNSVTLRDLEPETEYVVEVTSIVNSVRGNPTKININTRPVGAPERIETQPTDQNVRVTWTPVDNVDHYEVVYYPVGDRRNAVTKTTTLPSYSISGVEPGVYEITVTAVKSDHRSQPIRVRQPIGVKPPTNIDFADVTDDGFIVVWTPSQTRNVVKYSLSATDVYDLTQPAIIQETTDTFATFAGLPSGTTYLVEIVAETPTQSSEPLANTVTTEVPNPNNVRDIIPEEEDSIEITWDPVPHADNYEITYYFTGGEPHIVLVNGEEHTAILSHLEPGTEYVVEVKTIINETSSAPTKVKVTTPLEKPKKTDAQPLTENRIPDPSSVRISWEPNDAVPEYEVKYFTVTGDGDDLVFGEPQIIRVPGGNGGTILRNLLPGTEYVVEVTAVDGLIKSRPGTVAVTTTLDKPKRIEVQEPGDQEVIITWERPVGEVTEYTVQLIPSDGSDTIWIPVGSETNTVTATGLQPGTEYEVRIVAVNTDKNVESQPGIGAVRTKPAYVKPENVQLIPESNGSYTITWEAPADSRPVQNYIVRWTPSSGIQTERTLEVPGYENQATIPQLLPDTDYEIVIQAINKPLDERTDYNSIIQRIKTDIPALPDSVIAPEVSDNTIVVQWDHPTQDTYLTGYRVEVFPEGSNTSLQAFDVSRTTNRVTLTGLEPSTSYVIKVTPHIDLKPGEPATRTVTTDRIRTVPVPDYLTIPETTSQDIVIQWEPPHNYEFITKYNIVVEDENRKVILDQDVPGDVYKYTLTGLRPSAHYNVYVRSFVDDRPSDAAEEVATTLPAQPEGVQSSNVLSNQFDLFWTPPDGEVISYLVSVEPENSTSAQELFFEVDAPSILVPNVHPNTTYNVQVITLGPGNSESVPATLRVTTESAPDEEEPEPDIRPEESVNILPGQPEIVVEWTRLPDDVPVQSYQVIYRIYDSDHTNIITVPAGVGEIVLSSLEPREQYEVWVRALLDTGENLPVPVTGQHTVTIVPSENYTPLTEAPIFAPEDGKVSIIWENLGPTVTDYGVTYGQPESEVLYQVVVPGTYSSTLLTGLTPGEQYVINVIGVKDGQPIKVSNAKIGFTGIVPDETSVSTSSPTGVVKLQWVPIDDEDDEDRVIGYHIKFNRQCCLGEPDMSWVPGRESDNAIIELEPQTEYVFTVMGVTGGGQNKPVDSVRVDAVDEAEEIPPDWVLPETLTRPTHLDYGDEDTERIPDDYEDGVRATTPAESTTTEGAPTESTATVSTTTASATTAGATMADSTTASTTTDRNAIITRPRPRPASRTTTSTTTENAPTESETTKKSPIVILTRPRPRPKVTPASRTTTSTTTENAPTASTTTDRNVIVTRPRPRPKDTPTTAIPEPLQNALRTTAEKKIAATTRPTERPSPTFQARTPYEDEDVVSITPENGHVTVSWQPFFYEDDDGTYTVILTRPDRPDDVTEVVLPGDADTVTVTSLNPNVKYNVVVEASLADDSQSNFQIPVTINEDQLPRTLHPFRYLFKPTITSIEPFGEDATIVNWRNPPTQRREVTHYVLTFTPKHLTPSSERIRVEIPADKERTSHVVTGLLPNHDYIVTLQAANERTKTRSSTEKQDFVTGIVNMIPDTTPRTFRPRTTTPRTRPVEPYRPRTPAPTIAARRTTERVTERITDRVVHTPDRSRRTKPVFTTTARTTERTTERISNPVIVHTPENSRRPEPVTTTESAPQEGGIREGTTPKTTVAEEAAGVDVLPTYDGRIIFNWTPVTTPVDNYIFEYRPQDGVSPAETITIPGSTSWTSIPEPTNQAGYIITIYTEYDGTTEPLYDIQLGKSPNNGGYHLRYGPAPDSRTETTITTQEVYIPGVRTDVSLPDKEYSWRPGNGIQLGTEREYINWLRPVTFTERPVGGPNSVTLRWNPESTKAGTYRVELEPIDNPDARTIVQRVRSDAPTNIRGLQPGVSYRLYAKYIRSDGVHNPGDVAASFVIPAFSRFGVPVTTTQRRFGINEVWMKELRSGQLLLQWDEFPDATAYTIEYQSTDGILHRSDHSPGKRWIVLPRLEPGGLYTIHIYATVDGQETKIYTVTVRRKITAPPPPIKVEWFNMLGHSVDLSWLPPNSRVTGYKITYYLGTDEDAEREYVLDLPDNVTTVTLRDLIPGETYTVVIQTVRDDEISRPLSFPLTMVVPTVRRLFFQQTEPQVVVIRWDPLPDYVTGYIIRVKQMAPLGPDLVPETVLDPDQSEFIIPGVTPGVRYEFTIRTVIGNKTSTPVRLHLWTLRSENQLLRTEQTGTWTVTWSADPSEVDHWRIEVKRPGSATPVVSEDDISRFRTSYQIQNLTPGVEYIIYIYGVKNGVSSTPIQIRIPANPNVLLHTSEVNRRRPSIYPTGQQLVRRFTIRHKPDRIEIGLIPVTVVDRYIILYKKESDATYTSRGVTVTHGDEQDIAIVRDLEPGTGYNFSITAIKGEAKSKMNLNVRTPELRVIKRPLYPLQNIQRKVDPNSEGTGFFITWDAPRVAIRHYTVAYSYTDDVAPETLTLEDPLVYVPKISEAGHSATYTISYTALDGRQSPKSVMTVRFERSTSAQSSFHGRGDQAVPSEYEEEDYEQP